MPEREREPVFCSECQNEVKVEDARILDGKILCPVDLAKHSFFERLRARKLPQDYRRRSGKTFQSVLTSVAALLLVVGIAFIWQKGHLVAGVFMIALSVLSAVLAMFVADVIDLLLDIRDQLHHQQR